MDFLNRTIPLRITLCWLLQRRVQQAPQPLIGWVQNIIRIPVYIFIHIANRHRKFTYSIMYIVQFISYTQWFRSSKSLLLLDAIILACPCVYWWYVCRCLHLPYCIEQPVLMLEQWFKLSSDGETCRWLLYNLLQASIGHKESPDYSCMVCISQQSSSSCIAVCTSAFSHSPLCVCGLLLQDTACSFSCRSFLSGCGYFGANEEAGYTRR